MSYKQPKNKYVRLPFELSLANQINDNFTVSFGDRTATKYIGSDEFAKFIDNDYAEFLKDSQKNADMAQRFRMDNDSGAPEATAPRMMNIDLTQEPDETPLVDAEIARRMQEEERRRKGREDVPGDMVTGGGILEEATRKMSVDDEPQAPPQQGSPKASIQKKIDKKKESAKKSSIYKGE